MTLSMTRYEPSALHLRSGLSPVKLTVKADSGGNKPLPFAEILSKVFLPAGYPDSVTPGTSLPTKLSGK